jgi:hypothetical protein
MKKIKELYEKYGLQIDVLALLFMVVYGVHEYHRVQTLLTVFLFGIPCGFLLADIVITVKAKRKKRYKK